jgi:uncharacterized protein involved in exopolysaccharide biosynthesis
MKDFGAVLILTGIFLCMGSYLILRPQQYKDELKGFESVISRFPRWSIRILGVFIITAGITVFYLFLTAPK